MATASHNQSSNQISVVPFIVIGVLAVGFGLFAAFVLPNLPAPFHILPPEASVESQRTDALFRILIGIGGFVFFLVQALIYYAAIAFRAKPDDLSDGPNIHGHMWLEIIWTVIPSLTVVFLGIVSYNVWIQNTAVATDPNMVNGESIVINVTAQRFAWSFEYITNNHVLNQDGTENPEGKRVTFTTPMLYLYVGQEVRMAMNSRDVIHAFWMPSMRFKQDVMPGRTTYAQFTPRDVGNGWQYVMLPQPTTIYSKASLDSDPLWQPPSDQAAPSDTNAAPQQAAPTPPRFEFPYALELVDQNSSITLADGQDTLWLEVVMPDGSTGYLPVTKDTVIGRANTYPILCAELCGGGHGDMHTQAIIFENEQAFETVWYNPTVAANSVPVANPIEQGIRIIESYGCPGCHSLSYFPNWAGQVGPNLTGIADRAASRAVVASETMGPTTSGAEYIVQSLRRSQDFIVDGYPKAMPYFTPDKMPQDDLIAIVSFLCTQTASGNPADSTCGLKNWQFDANGHFTGDAEALIAELKTISDEYQ